MSARGRPSKYVSMFHVPWARSLARRGLTVQEIADEMGVSRSTFYKWVDENEDLSDALNEGRSIADSKVEDSLYRRALGFKVTEKKTIVSADPNGAQKPARIEVVEKDVPPDTTACIYWLKNRMPAIWRDQSSVALQINDNKEVHEEVSKIVEEFVKGQRENDP